MHKRQATVVPGLDVCLADPPPLLAGSKFGLLMNQASVNSEQHYAADLLANKLPGQLSALFSPQHGLWCEQQDNMIETPHSIYEPLHVPLHSLYSETRQPTPEMLGGLDCLVVDLQDVGTRVYTFVWTVTHCLQACAAAGIPMLVLDRPNPIGGCVFEGPLLQPGFKSFVGLASIPMRHGLTLGELSLLLNRDLQIDASLQVVPMSGWQRTMLWPDTGLAWIPPSPNMPRFETAMVYPGQVLLEGTNLSEGRGTTTPFEIVGAPFVEPFQLYEHLRQCDCPGLTLRPIRFRPTFNKWHNQSCGGVAMQISDPSATRSYATTLALLAAIQGLWPDHFELIPPPYEYETEKLPLDILSGSDQLSASLISGSLRPQDVKEFAALDESVWRERIADVLLY